MFDNNPFRFRPLIVLGVLLLAGGLLTACGSKEAAHDGDAMMDHDAMEDEAMETAMVVDDSAPRVFFANLSDGDEVTSPVTIEFGIENFEIVPAQDPIVIEDGKGHHHLGVNTHCLEPGVLIPKADPWIHFGDGSSSIDMQLPPGPAHLVLQVGNGEHRTLDESGLCAMINVTVVEGEAAQ